MGGISWCVIHGSGSPICITTPYCNPGRQESADGRSTRPHSRLPVQLDGVIGKIADVVLKPLAGNEAKAKLALNKGDVAAALCRI